MGLALAMSFSYVNADCSVSISDGNPSVGDSFTATVYYSGTEFGSTDGVFSYDPSILEFTGCSAESGGGGGEVRYSYYQTSGDNSMAVSFYFTVIGSGDGYVSANAETYDIDGNYFASDSSSNSFTVGGGAAAEPEPEPEQPAEDEGSQSGDSSESSDSSENPGAAEPAETSESTETSESDETSGTSGEESKPSDSEASDESSEDESSDEQTEEGTEEAEVENTEEETEEEKTEEETEEEKTEEEKQEEVTEDPIYVYYDGIEYQVLQCKNEDIPAGFTPAVSKYEGTTINVLRSSDKKILLAYLKNSWAGEEEEPSFFLYDEVNEFFYPAEFEEVGGKKYFVLSNEAKRLYGEGGYYYYDPAHGKAVPEDIDPIIAAAKEEALKAKAADDAKAEQQAAAEAAASEAADANSQGGAPQSRSLAPMVLLGITSLLLLAVILVQVKLLTDKNKQ